MTHAVAARLENAVKPAVFKAERDENYNMVRGALSHHNADYGRDGKGGCGH